MVELLSRSILDLVSLETKCHKSAEKLKIKYLKKIPKMLRNHKYSLGIKFY